MSNMIKNFIDRIRNWSGRHALPEKDRISRLFKFKYTCFKDLLESNTELLNIITDLEEKLRGQKIFGMSYVRSQAARAVFHTLRMVKSLDDLSGHRYRSLLEAVDKIDGMIKLELGKKKELPVLEYVLPYSAINKEMVDWVGGKNANLGELRNRLKLAVPEGFAITTKAYDVLLQQNDLIDQISRAKMDLDPSDPDAVNSVSELIQGLIMRASVPSEVRDAIIEAYETLRARIQRERNKPRSFSFPVALRSSAIGEDSELSFAGQYLSVLNVSPDRIVETYKLIVASLFTSRAISYRSNKGIRVEDIAMSVACIEMVESAASGVMYSRDPLDPLQNTVLINAIWGLGPYAVEGFITPDTYVVKKDHDHPIANIQVSDKTVKLVMNSAGGLSEMTVKARLRNQPCLSPDQIKSLAAIAVTLENHYNYPQDVEWALDPDGRLLVLQTRPLHLESYARRGAGALLARTIQKAEGHKLLLEGGTVAVPGVGAGPAFHVRSDDDLIRFPEGAVLIAVHSSPQFVIVMKKAHAIVADAGSVTGHMASLAREFGVPTLLGIKRAFSAIPEATEITVDAYSGRIYEGRVPELLALQRTRESAMKGTPVFQTLKRVCDWIVPLNLVDPRNSDFTPEHCKTLHDIMRYAHEVSYKEMFQLSDTLSDTLGGAKKLVAPVPLDLHIIDLGGGLIPVVNSPSRVTVDQISSIPLQALVKGMIHVSEITQGPRAVDFGGFLSVMREQMLSPAAMADRFGDRSYAIISDTYLNFSSRIGYHYTALDAFCGESVNKNYITFSFKGGAADYMRRNRRARSIAAIFDGLGFSVEVREDRVDARYYKYDQALTEEKLEMVGRMLQFTRQMDMLMNSEATVQRLAECFLNGNYNLEDVFAPEPLMK